MANKTLKSFFELEIQRKHSIQKKCSENKSVSSVFSAFHNDNFDFTCYIKNFVCDLNTNLESRDETINGKIILTMTNETVQ